MAKANNMESQTTVLEVLEELSFDEERERTRLELRVERAFFEAGAALRQLRDKRLYKSTHRTFEQYCKDRFGYTRRRPYQLIEAAMVFENLCTNGTQNGAENDSCTIGTQCLFLGGKKQILPTSERQVRDLINLEPNVQRDVWQQAVVASQGKVPNSRIVKGIVERLKEKPLYLATDFCLVGDVFTLAGLDGEERKYNGYPCVASELNDFTICVEVYDTTLAVKPENLKKIGAPDVRRQLPAIQKRIKRVRSAGQLDRGAGQLLKHLARQIYLTDVEEGLLQWLENHYGV